MTDKCVNDGNWVRMCKVLTEVTSGEIGDIKQMVMTIRDGRTRLAIAAGRFKKNRVLFNYCPFCGADIQTEMKEKDESNE